MPKLPKFEDWTPPWGDDDDNFDAEKAKKLIYGLTSDKEKAAERVSTANARTKARLSSSPTAAYRLCTWPSSQRSGRSSSRRGSGRVALRRG